MEGNLGFLFAAVFATWVVIFLYLLFLAGRLAALRRDLDALKADDPERSELDRDRRSL